MKRLPIKHIILAVTLGIITTITVAWGCAFWIDVERGEYSYFDGSISFFKNWQVEKYQAFGAERIVLRARRTDVTLPPDTITFRRELPPWLSWDLEELLLNGQRYNLKCADARGWPWPALWCEASSADPRLGLDFSRAGTGGIVVSETKIAKSRLPTTNDQTVLPLRPLPWSFTANSALFTLCWSLFLMAFPLFIFGLRSFLRKRKGLCPACGYNLHNLKSNRCPECGTIIIHKKQSTKQQ